jgi:hypothetical protein
MESSVAPSAIPEEKPDGAKGEAGLSVQHTPALCNNSTLIEPDDAGMLSTTEHAAAGAGTPVRQTVFEVRMTELDGLYIVAFDELLQVCITNAGKWMKKREMQKIVDEAGIPRVYKLLKDTHALAGFIWFTSLEDRAAAIPELQNLPTKGSKWKVRCNAPREEVVHSHVEEAHESHTGHKRSRASASGIEWSSLTPEQQAEKLADAVAPWHNVLYSEQLERKQASMQQVLRDVTSRLRTHV